MDTKIAQSKTKRSSQKFAVLKAFLDDIQVVAILLTVAAVILNVLAFTVFANVSVVFIAAVLMVAWAATAGLLLSDEYKTFTNIPKKGKHFLFSSAFNLNFLGGVVSAFILYAIPGLMITTLGLASGLGIAMAILGSWFVVLFTVTGSVRLRSKYKSAVASVNGHREAVYERDFCAVHDDW